MGLAKEETAEVPVAVEKTEQQAELTEVAVPKAETTKPATESAPVVSETEVEPESQSFWTSPLFLSIAGIGTAVVALLLLLSRRKAKKTEDEEDQSLEGVVEQGDTVARPEDGLDILDSSVEEATGFISDLDASEADSTDPIAKAESYISFGRFSQATDVLLKAIDAEPQREDLRFKLLEVYADLEDRNAFTQQVDELIAMGVAPAKLEALRQRFPHFMGEDADGLAFDNIVLDVAAAESSVHDDSDLLAGEIPELDSLLADTATQQEDDFSDLLDAVELDTVLEPLSTTEEQVDKVSETQELGDFDLPDMADLDLDDLQLDDVVSEVAEDGAAVSLDDLQLDAVDADLATKDAEAADFDLDLDLSLPVEESAELGALDELLQYAEAGSTDQDALEQQELDAGLDLSTPELPDAVSVPKQQAEAIDADDMLAELEQELDDDFSFLQGDDEQKTKLDLASVWIEMGDLEGAREILEEVMREGKPEHQEQDRELIAQLD